MEIRRTGNLLERMNSYARNGLRGMAMELVTECQATLSVVNPGASVKYSRPSKSGAKTHSVYGTPSQPGEAPRQRTGWGKGHVGFQVGEDQNGPWVRVGVPEAAIYLGYHEAGIHYANAGLQQRPWLMPTFQTYQAVLQRIFQQYRHQ